jgi:hypothetical protein
VDLSEHRRIAVVGVHRVERIQALEVFEGFLKECAQESFLILRVIRKFQKIRPSELLRDNAGNLCLEGLQEASQVCTQVDEFHGGTLSHLADFIRRNGWSKF